MQPWEGAKKMLNQQEIDRLLRLQAQKEVYDLAKRWEIEPLSEADLQEIWAEWVGCFRRVTERAQKQKEAGPEAD